MEESVVKIIVKGKEYTVPLTSRVEILLKQLINSGGGSGGSSIPEGYTIASDDDIDNLFP